MKVELRRLCALPSNSRSVDGQVQLQGARNLPLVGCGDIGPDRLGGTFYGFGRHFKAGQQFDLLTSMVEWSLRPHQRQHAADARRQIRFFYIQATIGRALSVMTIQAQIPGGATTRPLPRRSTPAANAFRGNGPSGRTGKRSRVDPGREGRHAVTGSTRSPRLDASQPAWPFRPLPDRVRLFCAARERRVGVWWLLPARLPDGWFPPFFFLRRQRVFDRPSHADLFIRLDQGAAEFLILPELRHLPFGFALRRRIGKAPRNGLASRLVREPEIRAMTGIVRLVAMTPRSATTASGRRDRATTKIAQFRDIRQYLCATLLQIRKGFRHEKNKPPVTWRNIYARVRATKKGNSLSFTFMSPTPGSSFSF